MEIKQLIAKLKLVNPQVEYNIFKSVENVMLNQVIAYKDDEGRHSFWRDSKRNKKSSPQAIP